MHDLANFRTKTMKYDGVGTKIENNNRSSALPRKKSSFATMHQVYISGAWNTMFDLVTRDHFTSPNS